VVFIGVEYFLFGSVISLPILTGWMHTHAPRCQHICHDKAHMSTQKPHHQPQTKGLEGHKSRKQLPINTSLTYLRSPTCVWDVTRPLAHVRTKYNFLRPTQRTLEAFAPNSHKQLDPRHKLAELAMTLHCKYNTAKSR
jgi:hypothetical protein